MALIIDGQSIQTNVRGIGNPMLMNQTMEFIQNKHPFRLYSASHKGLLVNVNKMICYDKDNEQITHCDNIGQLQWILQCAMICYDKVEPLQDIHVIEFVKKLLEL